MIEPVAEKVYSTIANDEPAQNNSGVIDTCAASSSEKGAVDFEENDDADVGIDSNMSLEQ